MSFEMKSRSSKTDENVEINHIPVEKKETEIEDAALGFHPCYRCLKSDFFKIEANLIRFKLFFFFFCGSIGSVFPFFALYFKQLGFSPNQIGLVFGVRPIIGFCSGTIWGSIADRFRIRKFVLLFSVLAWLGFITSIGFVPPASMTTDNCYFVDKMLKRNESSVNSSQNIETDYIRDHHFRPGETAEENLQKDRGWMYGDSGFNRVFATVLILVILGEIFQSPAGALSDSACIGQLGDTGMDKYGHQRAFGSLGLGMFSMIVGGIISTTRYTVTVCGYTVTLSDYHMAFYFFAGCMVCCFFTSVTFKFPEQNKDKADQKPRPNPLKVFRMFLSVHFGSWLFSMFFTGICNGVIWGFLFWHLENIGATQFMIGVATTTQHVSEIIMFYLVFLILRKISCVTFMALGFLGYSLRFVVFAAMDNPWYVIPVEVLQGFTFAGIWSVYTKYLCSSVPPEYLATLQGFLHGVYWGLGAGTGFMIGGVLVEHFGATITFWVFSIASFVQLVLFILAQKFSTKPNVFENYEELKN